MTLFGTDISSYQAGLNVAHLPDAYVLMKCTEDVSYVDADYAGWLAATKASGKLPVAYHFIGPSDPAKQAAHLAAHIIDHTVPVMVDFEDEGSFHPTLAQLLALDDAIKAVGLHVVLNYFPAWKHRELGSPSLAGLTQRGIGLVSSNYPNLTVAPAGQVYAADGGDSGSGWNAYGGVTPVLWQFSDRVSDGGQQVDMNAYRGTFAQLAAFLGATTPAPTTPGGSSDMSYTVEAGWQRDYPDVAAAMQQHIPVGTVLDVDHASGYSAMRSFVAAERAGVIEQKLDQVLSKLGAPADVSAVKAELDAVNAKIDALPGLINQHVADGASVDQLASAVLHHLSAATANG